MVHACCDPCKVSALGRCSHVVAVLLTLVDHVTLHGSRNTTPCTSQECTWNKGKKRQKNPKRLSEARYSTKRKQSKVEVIDFDPRPEKYRRITNENINNFVSGLQNISQNEKKISMWETQLQTTYKDYKMIETTEVEMKVRVDIKSYSTTFDAN